MSISNTELAAKLDSVANGFRSFVDQQIDWLIGTGTVTLTDPYDANIQVTVRTPAKLESDFAGRILPIATAVNQVPVWNGTAWVAAEAPGGGGGSTTFPTFAQVTGDPFGNTLLAAALNARVLTSTLSGYVTNSALANTTFALNRLQASGASPGQVPVWNGTSWAPGTVSGGGPTTLDWGQITGSISSNSALQGALAERPTLNFLTTNTLAAYLTVSAFNAARFDISRIDGAGATNGQVPVWNSTTARWVPGTVSGGGGSATWGSIGGSIANQTDLTSLLSSSLSAWEFRLDQIAGGGATEDQILVRRTVGGVTQWRPAAAFANWGSMLGVPQDSTPLTNRINSLIADATIQYTKLAAHPVPQNVGQVLTWNGTTWEPQTPFGGIFGAESEPSVLTWTGNDVQLADLSTFVTDSNLGTKLTNYVTQASLNTQLIPFATEAEVAVTLSSYVTQTSLDTQLGSYVTQSQLVDFGENMELPLGQLAAEGATTGQVMSWNGSSWAPATPSGGSGSGLVTELNPDPPDSNELALAVSSEGDMDYLAVVNSEGFRYTAQPQLVNYIQVLPNNTANNGPGVVGMGSVAAFGTWSWTGSPSRYNGVGLTENAAKWFATAFFSTSSSAGSEAGIRFNSSRQVSTATGLVFRAAFSMGSGAAGSVGSSEIVELTPGFRLFVGLIADFSGSTIGNVNPSTLLNCIGFGCDAGDTTLHLIHNDGSGTATKVNLGSNFPVNYSNRDLYKVLITSKPGRPNVYYRVERVDTGHVASGVLTNDVFTHIDPGGREMSPQIWINNGTNAAVYRLGFVEAAYSSWRQLHV